MTVSPMARPMIAAPEEACVVRGANMGQQLAGGSSSSSWCPELEVWTTYRHRSGGSQAGRRVRATTASSARSGCLMHAAASSQRGTVSQEMRGIFFRREESGDSTGEKNRGRNSCDEERAGPPRNTARAPPRRHRPTAHRHRTLWPGLRGATRNSNSAHQPGCFVRAGVRAWVSRLIRR